LPGPLQYGRHARLKDTEVNRGLVIRPNNRFGFPKGNGVTHVSGTICHLCLGPPAYLQLTAGLHAKVGFANINAKAEGIESKPAFREAFQRRRCLVPVDNFYE
jgi:hypothetical protein